jgi:glycosyltransferase involved in cell wall biosynthesis
MVSIIIPCYNSEDTIDECIESLVYQSYKDIEVIAVDDGSTDTTGAKLDGWAQKDIRVKVFHTDNHGRSAARNTGIDSSHGDYISFVDSDDTVKPEYIKTMIMAIKENDADIAAISQYYNDLASRELKYCPAVNELTVYDGYHQYVADTYLDKGKTFFVNNIIACSKLYKRSLFDDVRFPVNRICEDCWVFPYLVSQSKKIVVLPDCLYFYRQRYNGTTKDLSSYTVESKVEAWINNIEWWRSKKDKASDELLAYCEKYICHYLYTSVKYISPEKKESFKAEYKRMVNHMIHSKYLPFKTKFKYLTFAMPLIVWH